MGRFTYEVWLEIIDLCWLLITYTLTRVQNYEWYLFLKCYKLKAGNNNKFFVGYKYWCTNSLWIPITSIQALFWKTFHTWYRNNKKLFKTQTSKTKKELKWKFKLFSNNQQIIKIKQIGIRKIFSSYDYNVTK